MADHITPRLEIERGPVLWGGAVTLVGCSLALLVVEQSPWMFPAAIAGGLVAGFRGDFYSQTASNGFSGVLLGVLLLLPVVIVARLVHFAVAADATGTAGDIVFVTNAGWLSMFVVRVPIMLIFGYLSAAAVGRFQPAPERRLRQL